MYPEFIQFSKGLEKHIFKKFRSLLERSEAESNALISKHLATPDEDLDSVDKMYERDLYEIGLKVPKLFKKQYIIKYCILSWYCDPLTKFELQEFLRKRCTQLKLYEEEVLYLTSKNVMLYTLFRENDYKHSNLFGNVLQPGVQQNQYISTETGIVSKRKFQKDQLFLILKKKPKHTALVYRRGYKDKGSLPPPYSRKRNLANIDLEYYEKELIREQRVLSSRNKLLSFILEMKAEGIDT